MQYTVFSPVCQSVFAKQCDELAVLDLIERGVQIRAGLEKKSGFVQWAAMTALLLAVFLLGVFRAGYIPSGFIYTQF